MKSLLHTIKILVNARHPWPVHQDFSFLPLTAFILLPLLFLNIASAYFSSGQVSDFTLLSAGITPVLNIIYSAAAFYLMARLFKGTADFYNSLLIAFITNLPFMLLFAVSFHTQSQFIWLGLLFSFYILWWGSGYLLNINSSQRIQFILFSLIFLSVFWIITIFIIDYFI